MTVLDASACIDALVSARGGQAVRDAIGESVDVPAPFTAEVVSGLRKLARLELLTPRKAVEAIAELRSIERQEHSFTPFIDRAWELRHNVSVYDAWYIALAESLETELITTDARLAAADGARCVIRYLGT